jgi:cell division septation protein DedD
MDPIDSAIAAAEALDAAELAASRKGSAPEAAAPGNTSPSAGTASAPVATDVVTGAVVGTNPADGFLISFASLINEARAKALSDEIRARGVPAHVLESSGSRGTIYRVVSGPFATREAADRAGKAAGRDYWIVENRP